MNILIIMYIKNASSYEQFTILKLNNLDHIIDLLAVRLILIYRVTKNNGNY